MSVLMDRIRSFNDLHPAGWSLTIYEGLKEGSQRVS